MTEEEIENLVTYGDGHGTPFNYFKNVYFDGRFIGRTTVRSSFLDYHETTEIYFPCEPYVSYESLKQYGIEKDESKESNQVYKIFKDDELGAVAFWLKVVNELNISLDEHYSKVQIEI